MERRAWPDRGSAVPDASPCLRPESVRAHFAYQFPFLVSRSNFVICRRHFKTDLGGRGLERLREAPESKLPGLPFGPAPATHSREGFVTASGHIPLNRMESHPTYLVGNRIQQS